MHLEMYCRHSSISLELIRVVVGALMAVFVHVIKKYGAVEWSILGAFYF